MAKSTPPPKSATEAPIDREPEATPAPPMPSHVGIDMGDPGGSRSVMRQLVGIPVVECIALKASLAVLPVFINDRTPETAARLAIDAGKAFADAWEKAAPLEPISLQ